jgi:hypothetical protein
MFNGSQTRAKERLYFYFGLCDHAALEQHSIGVTVMATKADIYLELKQNGVELSHSKLRKTTIADLQAMLDAKRAEIERVKAARKARGLPKPASNVVELPTRKRRTSKGISIAPKPAAQLRACRTGTKQAALVDALADGATMWELLAVCSRNVSGGSKDWSENSIRSAFYFDVHHVKGYGVETVMMTPRALYDMGGHEASAEHFLGTEHEYEPCIALYRLVLPAGMKKPLAHEPARPVKMAANRKPLPHAPARDAASVRPAANRND